MSVVGSYQLERIKGTDDWRAVLIYKTSKEPCTGPFERFELGEPVHLCAPLVHEHLFDQEVWWLHRIDDLDVTAYAILSRTRDSNREDLRCCVTALRKIPAMLRIAIEAS